jgi:hypothetical protein
MTERTRIDFSFCETEGILPEDRGRAQFTVREVAKRVLVLAGLQARLIFLYGVVTSAPHKPEVR